MYSALHIMQWFSQVLDVFTPKIKRPFSDFYILWIKTNVAYTRLEMIARTKYCTTTTASNWFVTLYYKLLPAVRSSSKHGRWRFSLLLYSISMVKMVLVLFKGTRTQKLIWKILFKGYCMILKKKWKILFFNFLMKICCWHQGGRTRLPKFKFSAKFPIGLHVILQIQIKKFENDCYFM